MGLRYINFAGTKDTYVYPYPNVDSDPTESYGTDYGWYYSAWDNTTNLWASQRGFGQISNRLSVSHSGLDCKGWSADGSAEGADIATCFYNGGHGSPSYVYDVTWKFFGLEASPAPPPAGTCPKTCSGYTCDEWYDYNGNTCAYGRPTMVVIALGANAPTAKLCCESITALATLTLWSSNKLFG